MRAYDRWRALQPRQQRLTCVSALAVATTALLMRVVSTQRLLRHAARPVRGAVLTDHEIGDRIDAIERAARYIPGATCLAKSVALVWMLRGRGIAAQIRVGVRTIDGFESHAWVDLDGVALTDDRDADGGFAELTRL